MTFWYFTEHLIQLTSTGSWYKGNFHVKTQVFVSFLAWFGFFCQLGLETFIKFGSGHFYRTELNKPNHPKTAEPNPNRTEPKCSVEHYMEEPIGIVNDQNEEENLLLLLLAAAIAF